MAAAVVLDLVHRQIRPPDQTIDRFQTSSASAGNTNGQPEAGRRKKLLIADMDSTIVTTETLDELAGEAGLKDVIAEITKDIPLGNIPDDADCANAVAFLASDLASVITGAELNVNGGEVML